MPGPRPKNQATNEAEFQAESPVDPHGLLLRLALAPQDDDDLTEAELESAVEILAAPGGLAYAYRVLEDATLLREHLTDGPAFDDDAPVQNALTGLLLNDELVLYDESGPAPLSPGLDEDAPAPRALTASEHSSPHEARRSRDPWTWMVEHWRGWTSLGGVALAAAVLIFVVPDAEPGVKGMHQDSFFAPPLRLLSASTEGPVQKRAVLETLTRSVPAFARCAPTAVVWSVSFTIAPDGLTRDISVVTTLHDNVVDAARSERISACFAAELGRTAFGFGSVPTVVQLSIAREGD